MSVRTSYRRTRIGWTGSCAAPQLDGSMADAGSWSNFCCGTGLPPGVTAAQAAALVPAGVAAICAYHGTMVTTPPPPMPAPVSSPPAVLPAPPTNVTMPVPIPGPVSIQLPVASMPSTNVSPISATQTTPATSSYLYTADEEAVQQLLYQYGDTWDNPQKIVMQMYAAGIPQGGVNQSNALPFLTGLATTAATSTSSLTSMISAVPTWGWIAAGVGALFLFGGKGK